MTYNLWDILKSLLKWLVTVVVNIFIFVPLILIDKEQDFFIGLFTFSFTCFTVLFSIDILWMLLARNDEKHLKKYSKRIKKRKYSLYSWIGTDTINSFLHTSFKETNRSLEDITNLKNIQSKFITLTVDELNLLQIYFRTIKGKKEFEVSKLTVSIIVPLGTALITYSSNLIININNIFNILNAIVFVTSFTIFFVSYIIKGKRRIKLIMNILDSVVESKINR